MIGTEYLSKEAKDSAEKMIKLFFKGKEDFYDNFDEYVQDYIGKYLEKRFLLLISYEVDTFLKRILKGDRRVMEELNLFNNSYFDDLPEIRLAIWKEGSKEIQKSIIQLLTLENEQLRHQIQLLKGMVK